MTITPDNDDHAVSPELRQRGRRLATSVLAVCAALFAAIAIGSGLATSFGMLLGAAGTIATALVGGWLWQFFAVQRHGLSYAGAVAAGFMTVPVANFVMWALMFVLINLLGVLVGQDAFVAQGTQLPPLSSIFQFTLASTVQTGWAAAPIAIAAMLGVTRWMARQLERSAGGSAAS